MLKRAACCSQGLVSCVGVIVGAIKLSDKCGGRGPGLVSVPARGRFSAVRRANLTSICTPPQRCKEIGASVVSQFQDQPGPQGCSFKRGGCRFQRSSDLRGNVRWLLAEGEIS